MALPVNFDRVSSESILIDWLRALQDQSVEAIAVLGPDPFGAKQDRIVLAHYPARVLDAAIALADSDDFGVPWRDSDASLVVWQDIGKSADAKQSQWRRLWLAHGYQSLVRVEFPLPANRAFECFMFSSRSWHDRAEAASVTWSALNIWPLLKRALAAEKSPLTAREAECLGLAFEGLSGRETSIKLGCSERTVAFHLANAMAKLKVDNKLAAIQRACWCGLI